MKYTAITFDNQQFPFDEMHLPKVEQAMGSGQVVKLPGGFVKGTDIRRIEAGSKPSEYGPHLAQNDVQDVFGLESGPNQGMGFWEAVYRHNMANRSKKPWLFKSVIEWGKKESGFTSPNEVIEFVLAEWETAKEHNYYTTPNDITIGPLTIEFYETDAGKEYARKVRFL